MKKKVVFSPSRRFAMESAAKFAGLTAFYLGTGRSALGATKLAKSAVQYQNEPRAGKDCDDCIQFLAGATPKSDGSCKIVEGAISPHGYCIAFTPKRR